MARVLFAYSCPTCPGDGVVRARRPGVDWPEPCVCEARRAFTQYQLARLFEEQPRTIVRINEGRSQSHTCVRVLNKIARLFPSALLASGEKP